MTKCAKCGAELTPDTNFCTACGARVDAAPTQANPTPVPTSNPTYNHMKTTQPPAAATAAAPVYQTVPAYAAVDAPPPAGSKYELISTWGFIGITLLMCIPIVGQILVIIWAFGGCKKIQKRNYARASLVFMIISLIFTIFIGLKIKAFVDKVNDNLHVITGQMADTLNLEEIADLLSGIENVASGNSDDAESVISDIGSFVGENTNGEGLAAILGALGDGEGEGLQALAALAALTGGGGEGSLDPEALAALAALAENSENNNSGNGTTDGTASLDDLVSEIESINAEASAKADGWPSSLPDYPDGTMKSVETYRTEISGTSKESMLAYIETLKKNGYEFKDFYDIGMSEQDMLDMNAWWGTNGKYYLSFSCYEGTVTVDHMTELPDLSSLLGG